MRLPFLDVLRGIAVVLMIYTHALGAWLAPLARQGLAHEISSCLFAVPSRLFLLLLGTSFALRLHAEAHRGGGRRTAVRAGVVRGAEILAIGMTLRVHDFLSHAERDPARLWKVDILNCMALALALLGLLCTRRDGRPAPGRALALAAVITALGPLTAGHRPPLPAPLGAYLYGPRPLAHFPLIPWLAFALLGLAFGDGLRRAADPARAMRRAAVLALIVGVGAWALRRACPPGPTVLAVEADPLMLLIATAALVVLAAAVHAVCERFPRLATPGNPLTLLGQASLSVYVVHLWFCYGWVGWRARGRLGLPDALLGFAVLTTLMIGFAALWRRARRYSTTRRRPCSHASASAASGSRTTSR